MAIRGKRPKATALKIIEGNLGKRSLSQGLSSKMIENMTPPSWLKGLARRKWQRICPDLQGAGLMTTLDRTALAMFCVVYARWRLANEHIDKEGLVEQTRRGHMKSSPYVVISNKSFDQMRSMLGEIGMSPCARARMDVPTPADDSNPFARFGKR